MSVSRFDELKSYYNEYKESRDRLFGIILDIGAEENASSGMNFVEYVNRAWDLGIEVGSSFIPKEKALNLLWAASLFAVSWYHKKRAHETFYSLLTECPEPSNCEEPHRLTGYAKSDFQVYRGFLLEHGDEVSSLLVEDVAEAQERARELYRGMFRKRNLVIVDTMFKPLAQARLGRGVDRLKPPLNGFVRKGIRMLFGVKVDYSREAFALELHNVIAGNDQGKVYDANSGLWHLGKGPKGR